jgi:hypothetical protein
MLAALAVAAFLEAATPTRPTASDYEDFESCYGSFEGASTVLPRLKTQIDATDFATIEHAMQNLAIDLADLAMRLPHAVFGSDAQRLETARLAGSLPWKQPQNQTLDYWSRNGPMSLYCFGLTKRLNEDLPLGF